MKKILLVEDYKTARELYQGLLQKAGYEVDTAADGDEGLTKGTQNTYDLVVIDLIIPKLSSLDLAKALLRQPNLAIMYTVGSEPQLQPFKNLGIDHFILKSTTDHQSVADAITRLISS